PRDSREQSSLEAGATRSPLGRRSLPRPARPAAVYAPQRIEAQHSSCQKRKERHENKRSARAAPTAFGRHRGGDRLGIHVRGFFDALWCSRLAEGIQLQPRNNALWHARRILQSQLDLPRCGIGKKIARNLL